MKKEEIKQILDFAIEKEQEAVDFYNKWAVKVESEAISRELLKMATMEESHRDRLKKVDVALLMSDAPSKTQDIKIADYVVAEKPRPDMTWREVLNIAMHRELLSYNLYKNLSRLATETAVKNIFEHLAAEEQNHKQYFEKIWDDEILKEN